MNWPRIRGYCVILLLADLAAIMWILGGYGATDPRGQPIGTDFLNFWSVSAAAQAHEAGVVYDPARLAAIQHRVFPALAGSSFYPWIYPPIALLLVWPLAMLPYFWSLVVWLSAGLLAYLAVLRRILPGGGPVCWWRSRFRASWSPSPMARRR